MDRDRTAFVWKIVTIFLSCALVVVSSLYAFGVGWRSFDSSKDDLLSSWKENTSVKQKLESFVSAAINKNDDNYIPKSNRVAVFDLDGTLFCETDPFYFDCLFLIYRVLEDPNYKDQASDFEKQVANKIVDQINNVPGDYSNLSVEHGQALASAFKGMTLKQFNDYIQEFKKQEMPSYRGMNRGGCWYKPMLEVVEYLQKNDFTVYVVSGTDRFIVRGLIYDSPLNILNSQIIGSDEGLVATHQNATSGLDYTYTSEDELVISGEFVIKNLKMNKVAAIAKEVGIQPVLSFGNSFGDQGMAQYVTTNNPYNSMAFMVCCDDLVREDGNMTSANNMYELCAEHNWIPISMKNDWKTIYGAEVERK